MRCHRPECFTKGSDGKGLGGSGNPGRSHRSHLGRRLGCGQRLRWEWRRAAGLESNLDVMSERGGAGGGGIRVTPRFLV